MKLRMPWFILFVAGMLALGCVPKLFAQTAYANLGPLSLPVPWNNMNAVYLYNVTDHINEVGGEMVFATLKAGSYQNNPVDIDFTAGGVLDPTGNNVGTGYAGLNINIPNPIPAVTIISQIQPGVFGGYAISEHKWVVGIKAAIPIFKS
jgi:hypothetical protein